MQRSQQRAFLVAGGASATLLAGERDEHLVLAVGAANSGKAFLQIAALEKGSHRLLDDWPPVLDAILERGDLHEYYLAYSARGEFLRQLGDQKQAKLAFERALLLSKQEPEQRFLRRKLAALNVT